MFLGYLYLTCCYLCRYGNLLFRAGTPCLKHCRAVPAELGYSITCVFTCYASKWDFPVLGKNSGKLGAVLYNG